MNLPAFKIDQRLPDRNRDRDPNQKPFRKNRESFFNLNSISDFQIKIGS